MIKNSVHFGKKRNTFYTILVWTTALACITTGVLAGCFIYTNVSINKYQKSVETLSTELSSVQSEVEQMEEEKVKYQGELEQLEQELAKYKPIIIPDSMKADK